MAREYVVRPGDSPAQIAIAHAGCPKCAIDLVRANPHKPTRVFPNGFVTFNELRPGEKLTLPDKWFDGRLDTRPPAYFAALPYADGVTPSTLGSAAAGVLSDYAALDRAAAQVGALSTMGDSAFHAAADSAGDAITAAVQETLGNKYAATFAQNAAAAVAQARQKNADLGAILAAGDTTDAGGFVPRAAALALLSSALGDAGLALQAFYGVDSGAPPSVTPVTFPPDVIAAATAASAALEVDPAYCASVANTGTAVNLAVHAFKTSWNASQNPKLPINTGNYEQSVADALERVIGHARGGCAEHAGPPATIPQAPAVTPPVAASASGGLSTGAVLGIGLLGASAIGGVIYLSTRKPAGRVRRVHDDEDDIDDYR